MKVSGSMIWSQIDCVAGKVEAATNDNLTSRLTMVDNYGMMLTTPCK